MIEVRGSRIDRAHALAILRALENRFAEDLAYLCNLVFRHTCGFVPKSGVICMKRLNAARWLKRLVPVTLIQSAGHIIRIICATIFNMAWLIGEEAWMVQSVS